MAEQQDKFHVTIEHTCTACAYSHSDPAEECEVCGGEVKYKKRHTISASDLTPVNPPTHPKTAGSEVILGMFIFSAFEDIAQSTEAHIVPLDYEGVFGIGGVEMAQECVDNVAPRVLRAFKKWADERPDHDVPWSHLLYSIIPQAVRWVIYAPEEGSRFSMLRALNAKVVELCQEADVRAKARAAGRVSMINAIAYDCYCPKCQHLQDLADQDPRGKTFECGECGTTIAIDEQAKLRG